MRKPKTQTKTRVIVKFFWYQHKSEAAVSFLEVYKLRFVFIYMSRGYLKIGPFQCISPLNIRMDKLNYNIIYGGAKKYGSYSRSRFT